MKKVLITGASGFIGRHVIPLLIQKGYFVISLSKSTKPAMSCLMHVTADLHDDKAVHAILQEHRPTHLLHLAWVTEHGLFWDSLDNIRWVSSTMKLIEAFHSVGGKRAVLAGTCAERGDYQNPVPECIIESKSPFLYGQAKHEIKKQVLSFAESHSLSFAWGRVFFLFGPYENEKKLIASMIQHLMQNKKFVLQNGELLRDFLHIEDVASAFACLIDSEVCGEFNIASGEGVRLKEIASILQQATGKNLIDIIKNQISNPSDAEIVGVSQRLRNELGWKPSYDLVGGLYNSVSWWKTHTFDGHG